MGKRLKIEGFWWTLSVVELFLTGGLADSVVVLEQPGLEVKTLIRNILGESSSNQDPLDPRNQGRERRGTGRNLVKGEEKGKERGNGRNLVNAPMIGLENVIERIGTTEIVREPGTGRGRETEVVTATVIVTVTGVVIGIEGETVVGTMIVRETETVTANVIVLVKGRGIMKLGSMRMTVGALIMIVLNQNMSGIVMEKGSMIILSLRMIGNGMNSLSTDRGTQTLTMTSVMNIMSIAVEDNMIMWMTKVARIAMISILIMIMIMTRIAMIEWKGRMITIMSAGHLIGITGVRNFCNEP